MGLVGLKRRNNILTSQDMRKLSNNELQQQASVVNSFFCNGAIRGLRKFVK